MGGLSFALGVRGRAALVMALMLLCTALAYCGGCFGKAAMDHAGVPALAYVGPRIRAEAQRGATADQAADVAAFFEAIESRDRENILLKRPLWPVVRAAAEADIRRRLQVGELGEIGARELIGRLDDFERCLHTLE